MTDTRGLGVADAYGWATTFKLRSTDSQIQQVLDHLSTFPAAVEEIRSPYLVYRDHPAHQSLIATSIAPIVDRRAAVQFESEH